MKATAVAPANIAFIKYWGRLDAALRIPSNPSISMNLSACTTTTTVEFSPEFTRDVVSEGFDAARITAHLNRLRERAGSALFCRVETHNSFPASTGIASSASGFAALTAAAAAALGLDLSERELAAFARLGSGSACRSIPDGFVKWEGEYARSLYPPDWWDVRDIIVVVAATAKKVSSSAGHDKAATSPFFRERLAALPRRIARLEHALKTRNMQELGETIEEDCLDMHRVMQTQNPPLYYWTRETVNIMEFLKKRTVPAYFTIDAGPNVHVLCEGKDEARVVELLKGKMLIINKPARGAHII